MGFRRHHQNRNDQGQWQVSAACRRPARITLVEWLSLALLIGTVILFPERPAWGFEHQLQADADGISGYAHQAPLGMVLSDLANKGGYTVYIDEHLYKSPTTFNMPMTLPAEKAIQRMVQPHSYALVFTKVSGRQDLKIEEIKVYAKGSQNASYIVVKGDQSTYTKSSHARGGYLRSHDGSSGSVHSGIRAVGKQVKPPVVFTKNAMGFTGFQFEDHRRGPDYRRDTMALAQAYTQYRQEREAMALRASDAQLQTAKQTSENQRNAYRSQRDQSIQQTIHHSNQ